MMPLTIFLFGKFQVKRKGEIISGFESRKAQELFCYLLLNRDRAYAREFLAEVLWPEIPDSQQRNYLRKALWQLQGALNISGQVAPPPILQIDSDWLQINPAANLRLDVSLFEQAYKNVQGLPGHRLDCHTAHLLCWAVCLYQGPLLEGWYADWCVYDRERLQYLYLAMLDKLMDFFEHWGNYEIGIHYGLAALRYESAREDTHRRLMRMYYLAGQRTAALHQYDRCVVTLRNELNVTPTEQTLKLYEQIRAGRRIEPVASDSAPLSAGYDPQTSSNQKEPAPPTFDFSTAADNQPEPLYDILNRLRTFEAHLEDLHRRVQQDIATLIQHLK